MCHFDPTKLSLFLSKLSLFLSFTVELIENNFNYPRQFIFLTKLLEAVKVLWIHIFTSGYLYVK